MSAVNGKPVNGGEPRQNFYCSFCGKSQGEVYRLFAGAICMICDECVDLCARLVSEAREADDKDKKEPSDG